MIPQTSFQLSAQLPSLIAVVIFVVIILIFVVKAVKIVKEYERIVVFRFGRVLAEKGPGLVLIYPFH